MVEQTAPKLRLRIPAAARSLLRGVRGHRDGDATQRSQENQLWNTKAVVLNTQGLSVWGFSVGDPVF